MKSLLTYLPTKLVSDNNSFEEIKIKINGFGDGDGGTDVGVGVDGGDYYFNRF